MARRWTARQREWIDGNLLRLGLRPVMHRWISLSRMAESVKRYETYRRTGLSSADARYCLLYGDGWLCAESASVGRRPDCYWHLAQWQQRLRRLGGSRGKCCQRRSLGAMGRAVSSALSVALALGLWGCATPQQRQYRKDWSIICEDAPLVPGSTITARQQHAMTRQDAWKWSVEEVNTRCRNLK